MTRDDATLAIKEKFPDAVVIVPDTAGFFDGIGVKYHGKRKAFLVKTPRGMAEAVQRLILWMERK